MKITVNRQNFLESLNTILPARQDKGVKPVLSHALLVAGEGSLALEATDLEIAMRTECRGVEVKRAGSVLIDPKKLTAILKESNADDLSLECDGDSATVKVGRGKFKLNTLNADEFPKMPDDEREWFTAVGIGGLIQNVSFAASRKEGSQQYGVTSGIHLAVNEGLLTVSATDTNVAARSAMKVETANCAAIVPAFAGDLVRTFAAGTVEVSLTATEARFRSGSTVLATKLLEGKFPPIDRVIPKKLDLRFPFSSSELLSAVKQASSLVDVESGRVSLSVAGGVATVRGEGVVSGSGEVELNCDTKDEIEVQFSTNYLQSVLKALEGGSCELRAVNEAKPFVIPIGEHGFYMLMPLVQK